MGSLSGGSAIDKRKNPGSIIKIRGVFAFWNGGLGNWEISLIPGS
jgi:hypothetical protein